jgi:hypothetical protein
LPTLYSGVPATCGRLSWLPLVVAIISFVELACAGTWLPATIVYVNNNVPASRSRQRGILLRRRAALVEFQTALLSLAMAVWLAHGTVPGLLGQLG